LTPGVHVIKHFSFFADNKVQKARANVRLDWKVIASYKHSSLLDLVISDQGKKFYIIDTWCPPYKTSFLRHYRTTYKNKLARFSFELILKLALPWPILWVGLGHTLEPTLSRAALNG
jgi:hypothetical protein